MSFTKRLHKSLALLLAMAISAPSFADTESLVLRNRATATSPDFQTAVTFIPEQDVAAMLAGINEHLKQDTKSAAIVATAGASDSIAHLPELADLQKNIQTESVTAASVYDLPAPSPVAKVNRTKALASKAKEVAQREKVGILVSVIPASGYGSLVLFMSSDYLTATVSFGLVLGINAFQTIFKNQWGRFVSAGDRAMLVAAKSISQFLGKPLSFSAQEHAERWGRLGWTTVLNSAVAVATLSLAGTLDSVWSLLAFGWASNWDTWDKVFENKLENSKLFNKYFVPSRLTLGTFLECLTVAGLQSAQMGLVGAAVGGTLALLFKPTRAPAIQAGAVSSEQKPRWIERIKLQASKIKNWFQRDPASIPDLGCASFLVRAM